ncbi:MAG: heme-binding protein [Planctomycetes bacterium]|nr:heme-binding protein [Planctomycetota bacterium]
MRHHLLACLATFAALSLTASAVAGPDTRDADRSNLIDTASADPRFTSFVTAVKAAGLTETLNSEGPFTVFAPTNDAFAALPPTALAALLRPENVADLKRVLLHHVVAGRVASAALLPAPSAATAAGTQLKFTVRIGDARLVQADIACSNGLIHAIDQVIVPPAEMPMASTRITEAIDAGAPRYNAGDVSGCAKLYAAAARDLLATPGAVSELRAPDLEAALANGGDDSARSWALRESFDRVLADESFRPRTEAPMPEGFPAAGPIGRIVTKTYPVYRAARAEGDGAFGTLFQHIKKNDVSMTAPVEMTLDAAGADDAMSIKDMAFLYERPTQGTAGTAERVAVLDLPSMTVLSMAMRGARTAKDVAVARAAIEARLAKDGLRRTGAFRLLGYNGPSVPRAEQLWEIQVPVETKLAPR